MTMTTEMSTKMTVLVMRQNKSDDTDDDAKIREARKKKTSTSHTSRAKVFSVERLTLTKVKAPGMYDCDQRVKRNSYMSNVETTIHIFLKKEWILWNSSTERITVMLGSYIVIKKGGKII